MNHYINMIEVEAFMNSIHVDVTPEKFYNMLGYDYNVKDARQKKILYDQNCEY
jgi:hypothetical protein